jgi:hypothetical protein
MMLPISFRKKKDEQGERSGPSTSAVDGAGDSKDKE